MVGHSEEILLRITWRRRTGISKCFRLPPILSYDIHNCVVNKEANRGYGQCIKSKQRPSFRTAVCMAHGLHEAGIALFRRGSECRGEPFPGSCHPTHHGSGWQVGDLTVALGLSFPASEGGTDDVSGVKFCHTAVHRNFNLLSILF